MKWYIGDYLLDTTHLTRAQHGSYDLLLMAMWRANGKLPNDPVALARIGKMTAAEWAEDGPVLMLFFKKRGAVITQKRLAIELEKYQTVVNQAKFAGTRSGQKRSNKNNENTGTDVQPPLNGRSTNQNQNQNQKEEEGKPSSTRAKRGGRIPDDWSPSEADIEVGLTKQFTIPEIEEIADEFRAYWGNRPSGATRISWSVTFQARLRELAKRRPKVAARPHANGSGSGITDFASIYAERRTSEARGTEIPGGGGLPIRTGGLFGD